MKHSIEYYESLPLREKTSWVQALHRQKVKRVAGWTDWDLTNQAHGRWSKMKAKNAKAKHRKKFNRR